MTTAIILTCMAIAALIGWAFGRSTAPAIKLDRYNEGYKAGYMACHASTMKLARAHDFAMIELQAERLTPTSD